MYVTLMPRTRSSRSRCVPEPTIRTFAGSPRESRCRIMESSSADAHSQAGLCEMSALNVTLKRCVVTIPLLWRGRPRPEYGAQDVKGPLSHP